MNLKKQHIGIPTNDIVHFLPFWENGVKIFKIVKAGAFCFQYFIEKSLRKV